MIRFLQKDNRLVKGIFIAIISVACITMVVTLVPGIFQDQTAQGDTYATVRGGGWLGKYIGTPTDISMTDVQMMAARMMQQQRMPQFYLQFIMPRVGQQLITDAVLEQEANRLGIKVTDEDLRRFLHTGMFGQVLFPKGQFIGEDKYRELISEQFNITTQKFESELKKELQVNRLRELVTGGITVSDAEVRDSYRIQQTKVKFDYAVVSADDVMKQINPTDAELETYFKTNAARYANAVPESRKIQYIAFNDGQEPGGAPQVTDAEAQQYYNQHQSEYKVDEQAKVRHILIKVNEGADAKTDAAAKAKAEDILKQAKAGGNFAELAKKYSDDPGSKDSGGELGFLKRGTTVPEFDAAAFSLPVGQFDLIRSKQYGYHIIQVEDRQAAHTKPFDEVKQTIIATLTRQKEAQQEQAYAQQLANEAQKNGLAKTAEAHHLQVVTTDFIQQSGIVPGLADSSKLLTAAFAAKKDATPQVASTGDGYAVFQVEDIKAAHAPTFSEYKSHVLDDYRQQQLPQLLAKKTNELADKAHAENDLAKAAKEVGATVKTSDLVGRTGQVPDIGELASAAPALFDLKPGQISSAIITDRNGVVAKLIDKQEPTPEDITKNLDQSRDALLNERRDQMFQVFVSNLVSRYEKEGRIRMNRRMQSALAQGNG